MKQSPDALSAILPEYKMVSTYFVKNTDNLAPYCKEDIFLHLQAQFLLIQNQIDEEESKVSQSGEESTLGTEGRIVLAESIRVWMEKVGIFFDDCGVEEIREK